MYRLCTDSSTESGGSLTTIVNTVTYQFNVGAPLDRADTRSSRSLVELEMQRRGVDQGNVKYYELPTMPMGTLWPGTPGLLTTSSTCRTLEETRAIVVETILDLCVALANGHQAFCVGWKTGNASRWPGLSVDIVFVKTAPPTAPRVAVGPRVGPRPCTPDKGPRPGRG